MNEHPDCYKTTLYMPIVAPPPAGTDPAPYYAQLPVTLTAAPAADLEGIRITATYPASTQSTQSAGEPPTPAPFSTVFAMTGGFVSFFADDKPFVLPDGQPLPLSSSAPPTDLGTLVLNIWGSDFEEVRSRVSGDGAQAGTILYRGVQTAKARQWLAKEVDRMRPRVLSAWWKSANVAGTPPADAAMRQQYLDCVMSGDAKVFVKGGTPLGEAAVSVASASDSVAEFQLHMFRGDAQQVLFVSPAALILAVGRGHA
jgi:hypothetical protein